jgi:hypothetical protein
VDQPKGISAEWSALIHRDCYEQEVARTEKTSIHKEIGVSASPSRMRFFTDELDSCIDSLNNESSSLPRAWPRIHFTKWYRSSQDTNGFTLVATCKINDKRIALMHPYQSSHKRRQLYQVFNGHAALRYRWLSSNGWIIVLLNPRVWESGISQSQHQMNGKYIMQEILRPGIYTKEQLKEFGIPWRPWTPNQARTSQ